MKSSVKDEMRLLGPRQAQKNIVGGKVRVLMSEKLIKNIDHETVAVLSEQVSVLPGQIVSKTLAQNKAVSLTLFAFDKGEEISEHDSSGDAMVYVLEGTGTFTVDGTEHTVKAGEALVMPAKKPHAVYARESFKMLLIVVFPKEK